MSKILCQIYQGQSNIQLIMARPIQNSAKYVKANQILSQICQGKSNIKPNMPVSIKQYTRYVKVNHKVMFICKQPHLLWFVFKCSTFSKEEYHTFVSLMTLIYFKEITLKSTLKYDVNF